MRVKMALLAVAAIGGITACEDDEPTAPANVVYTATLNGASERPNPITTNATGTFTGTLNPTTNVMTYTLTWQNLTTTSNNAHIHGPTAATGTATAGVLIDFNGGGRTLTHGTSGNATGTIDLNVAATTTVSGDSLKKLLDAGRAYVNVHSTTNPGGEILGIITKQ
jgi:hypothetical protein